MLGEPVVKPLDVAELRDAVRRVQALGLRVLSITLAENVRFCSSEAEGTLTRFMDIPVSVGMWANGYKFILQVTKP